MFRGGVERLGQIGCRIVNRGKIVYFLEKAALEKENLGE